MDVKKDVEVVEEIEKKYNKNPEGWRAFASYDGRYNFFVFKDKKVWQIKVEFITPYHKVGVGGRTKTEKSLKSAPTFGIRPVTSKQMRKIMNFLKCKGKIPQSFFKEIMKIKPESFENLEENQGIVEGPVLYLNKLIYVSEGQKKLDKVLSKELDKLVFREGGLIYG